MSFSGREEVVRSLEENGSVFISITGLKPHSLLHNVLFWYYTMPAYTQAQKAPGMLFLDTRMSSTRYHTFIIWKNKEAMKSYVFSGAHMDAMKNFKKIGTGRLYSYETSDVPSSWEEALRIWEENAPEY